MFETPTNGKAGVITINISSQGIPHEILMDQDGNTIFVNAASGMDIGPATLTPIDT